VEELGMNNIFLVKVKEEEEHLKECREVLVY